MNRVLALLGFILAVLIVIFTFPDGNAAIVVAVIMSFLVLLAINYYSLKDKLLLSQLFITSLFARLAFGAFVHVMGFRARLSGDSSTYHSVGKRRMETWFGIYDAANDQVLEKFTTGIGWGITYLVAGIYSITGADILSAQFFCAVLGAATVPLVFICVKKIFNNHRASLVAALIVGFYPAFIIWTSQLLKDGLIVFLLVLALVMILSLQEKFTVLPAIILIGALFGILSLRFYIFFMISAAMVGSFVVGSGKTNQSIARNLIVLIVLGVGLTYVSAAGSGDAGVIQYMDIERLQRSRSGAAAAESGFGRYTDITTAGGALTALPVGFVYVMFAPFPWQLTDPAYIITIPDMVLWWLSIPFLIIGLSYSIRNNLRGSLGIIIFSIMLTLAYSLFQGNIGTAYRHRIQIQVFLFIFVAVGWTIVQERRENKKALRDQEISRFNSRLKKNAERAISG